MRALAMIVWSCALLVPFTGMQQPADAPFFGSWRIVPAKSSAGATEMTFERNGDEFRQIDAYGRGYTFKIDGKGYTDQIGATAVWKEIDQNVWETTYYKGTDKLGVDRLTLSADERTLTVQSKILADGREVEQTAVLQRARGSKGLAGSWRGEAMQIEAFELHILPNGSDGVIYRVADLFEAKARFDGKPYPMTGRVAAPGATVALTRLGLRSFRIVQREPNVADYDATITVSEDGRTMTQEVQDGKYKRTFVLERIE